MLGHAQHVARGDQAAQSAFDVDQRQLLEPALVEHAPGFVQARSDRCRYQLLAAGHDGCDRCALILGQEQVARGDDAEQQVVLAHHQQAVDVVTAHQRGRLGERPGRGDGVELPAADRLLGPLHQLHLGHLPLDRHEAVNDADAAFAGHGARHARLGHGVHVGRDDRDPQRHLARQAGAGVDVAAGGNTRPARYEQHIVVGQGERWQRGRLHGRNIAGFRGLGSGFGVGLPPSPLAQGNVRGQSEPRTQNPGP